MIKNLKLLRLEKGLSQKQLAEKVNVSQQSINKYENHDVEPNSETLCLLADFFETSVDFLIGHTNIRHKIEQTSEMALNLEEENLIKKHRKLSAYDKETIMIIIDRFEK